MDVLSVSYIMCGFILICSFPPPPVLSSGSLACWGGTVLVTLHVNSRYIANKLPSICACFSPPRDPLSVSSSPILSKRPIMPPVCVGVLFFC